MTKQIHNCNECAEPLTGNHSIWCNIIYERTGLRIKDNPDIENGIKSDSNMLKLRNEIYKEVSK